MVAKLVNEATNLAPYNSWGPMCTLPFSADN